MKWQDTGCKNWRSVSITAAKTGLTLPQCQRECLDQLQCTGINYQTGSDCSGEGIAQGACFLLTGEIAESEDAEDGALSCERGDNKCWDLYSRPSLAPVVLPKPKYRTGCANIEDIAFDKGSKVWSKFECFEKCRTTTGCAAFNHQPGPSAGGPYTGVNWCRLLRDGCETKLNTRVDLYLMADTTTTTAKPEPAQVNRLECVKDASTCRKSWTEEKQTRCCDSGEFCCPQEAVSEAEKIFDCSDWNETSCQETWSTGKKVVCQKMGKECQM